MFGGNETKTFSTHLAIGGIILLALSIGSLAAHIHLVEQTTFQLMSTPPLLYLYLTLKELYTGPINTQIDLLYLTDPGIKPILDWLYLITGSAALALGPTAILYHSLSELPGCEKVPEMLDKLISVIDSGDEREEIEIGLAYVIIVVLLTAQCMFYFAFPVANTILLWITLLFYTIAMGTTYNLGTSIRRYLKQET